MGIPGLKTFGVGGAHSQSLKLHFSPFQVFFLHLRSRAKCSSATHYCHSAYITPEEDSDEGIGTIAKY